MDLDLVVEWSTERCNVFKTCISNKIHRPSFCLIDSFLICLNIRKYVTDKLGHKTNVMFQILWVLIAQPITPAMVSYGQTVVRFRVERPMIYACFPLMFFIFCIL